MNKSGRTLFTKKFDLYIRRKALEWLVQRYFKKIIPGLKVWIIA